MTKESVITRLREGGLKITPQRLAIIEVLIEKRHFHPGARLIYEEARKKKKSLSLSTAYATLNELSRYGIIKALQFDKMKNRCPAPPSRRKPPPYPVNAPRCPYRSYRRDGSMRVDGNYGSTLGYEPNSYGEWQEQPDFSEPPLKLQGDAYRWNYREDDNDYHTQPGKLFRLMSADQQKALFGNTARSIGGAPREIQIRHIGNCLKADPAYGKGVADALGIPLSDRTQIGIRSSSSPLASRESLHLQDHRQVGRREHPPVRHTNPPEERRQGITGDFREPTSALFTLRSPRKMGTFSRHSMIFSACNLDGIAPK
jgi:hypothetical protein